MIIQLENFSNFYVQNDAVLKTIIYIFLIHTLLEEFLFFYFLFIILMFKNQLTFWKLLLELILRDSEIPWFVINP